MSSFRRVDGARAGPNALGILVAPSARTLVVLRPRALEFDLLPIRATLRNGLGSGFLDLTRAEAIAVAQDLGRALEEGAAGTPVLLAPIPATGGDGYWVQAELSQYTLLACRRMLGQPYWAWVFPTLTEAHTAAAALQQVLCPAADAQQELYFNTQSFAS